MHAQVQASVRRVSMGVLALTLVAAAAAGPARAAGQTDPAPVLSLAECIRLALQDSPTLKVAGEREHIAAQGVKDAYGNFLPNVSVSYNWSKSERTDFDLARYDYVPGNEYYTIDTANDTTFWYESVAIQNGTYDQTVNATSKSWGARADLDLFSGFSKFTRLGAAKKDRDAAQATHRYTRTLVVEDVITAYYNLLRYEELLAVASETRDQAAKELERTETYFRLGSAAKSDVLQQRVRLENTKLDLVVAQNTVKKAFADLAYAMNQPLAATFEIDRSELKSEYPIEDLDRLYDEALTARLDLASSEYNLEARQKDIRTAESGLYPSVALFGNYSRSDNESPYKFGSQISDSFTYGYQVSWNVFDRLSTWTGRSRAKANARIAEYELEQARMNVQVEIRQLHNSLVEARERLNVSRETIKQSQEELRLAQERFRVGAGTTLDVITAQVNLASARRPGSAGPVRLPDRAGADGPGGRSHDDPGGGAMTEGGSRADGSGRPIIEVSELTRTYEVGSEKVYAVRGVDLTVREGEYVAIMGSSGSGKSTLMNMLGCLDTPTSGTYRLPAPRSAPSARTSSPRSATARSASSSRPSICCRAARPPRTWSCRWSTPASARGNGRDGWPPPCRRWGCPIAPCTGRTNCRAGRGSASPSPAPWSTIRR